VILLTTFGPAGTGIVMFKNNTGCGKQFESGSVTESIQFLRIYIL